MEKFREKLGLYILYAPCYLPDHVNPQRLFKQDKLALKRLYAGNKYLEDVYTNFIAKDEPTLPKAMVRYNTELDKHRGTNFFKIFPQYAKYNI